MMSSTLRTPTDDSIMTPLAPPEYRRPEEGCSQTSSPSRILSIRRSRRALPNSSRLTWRLLFALGRCGLADNEALLLGDEVSLILDLLGTIGGGLRLKSGGDGAEGVR